jgi:hypothetical protein
MRRVSNLLAVALVLAFGDAAEAQTAGTAQGAVESTTTTPATAPAAAAAEVVIPAGTTITVEFTETLSSHDSQTGQLVGLRLVEPLVVEGRTIAEPGAVGGGEVIDASRSGMGGRSGKLIVSGRFIEVGGQHARIRGLQVVIAGEDNSREAVNTMILVPYVGWMGGFIQGGEISIPAGTRAQARFATEVHVPLSALPTVVATTAPPDPTAVEQPASEVEERQ